MMNNANEISKRTKLYGFIGENAGSSSFSATLNKVFKAQGKDAMMIPMNIREDDFFFTLSNMKRSHVNGALISNEYLKNSVEILDEASEAVIRSKICDIVIREDQKLMGDILGMRVLNKFLAQNECKKVALIGIDERAKAFCCFAKDLSIALFYHNLEEAMKFCKEMSIEADINRIAKNMSVDLKDYDAVIDFCDFESLDMVSGLGRINLDMKSKKEFSPLKARSDELGSRYIGFDDMLSELSSGVFEYLKEKKHLD